MVLTALEKLQRLDTCTKVRNIAAQTCLYSFQQILHYPRKVSEVNFKNRWLKELERSFSKGYISCWYDPPPNGMAVLFGNKDDFKRVSYPTLRIKTYWPKAKIYFQDDGLGYIFASPFTIVEEVPIIGDFGLTFYLGESEKIKDHFKKCYEILNSLIENIKIGMAFKEIYDLSNKIIKKNSLINYVQAVTDKAGTDFGHTVPFIDRNPTSEEKVDINMGESGKINKVISSARIFINEYENFQVSENCAFTFEPRFLSLTENLPMCSFHLIIQFYGQKKTILSNFGGLFNLLGMSWLNN